MRFALQLDEKKATVSLEFGCVTPGDAQQLFAALEKQLADGVISLRMTKRADNITTRTVQ